MRSTGHTLELLGLLQGLGVQTGEVLLHTTRTPDGVLHASASADPWSMSRRGCVPRGRKELTTLERLLTREEVCPDCLDTIRTRGGWSNLETLASMVELALDAETLLSGVPSLRTQLSQASLLQRLETEISEGLPRALRTRLEQLRARATMTEKAWRSAAALVPEDEVLETVEVAMALSGEAVGPDWMRRGGRQAMLGWLFDDAPHDRAPLERWLENRYGLLMQPHRNRNLLYGPGAVLRYLMGSASYLHSSGTHLVVLEEPLSTGELETLTVLMRDDPMRELREAVAMARAL